MYKLYVQKIAVCAAIIIPFQLTAASLNNGYFSEQHDEIIWSLDWEINPYYKYERAHSSNLKWATQAREGNYGAKVTIRKSDVDVYGAKRAELLAPLERGKEIERWYAFSTLLNSDYVYSSYPESFFQVHTSPADGNWNRYVTTPISLQTIKGHYRITIAGSNEVPSPNLDHEKLVLDIGDYSADFGLWSDWVLHIKYSGDADVGFLKLWKGEDLVINYSGAVGYAADSLDHKTYAKFGLYRWNWQEDDPVESRIMYYDRIRVGNKFADFEKMNADIADNNPEF
ncbi:polysaccharide lyase [Pseudoalteromonas sp.]|uniref:polysaccharide lyase n=1 Tax=Pseudoalteromonas sp. TaxID=53249 RepID=UPI003002B575